MIILLLVLFLPACGGGGGGGGASPVISSGGGGGSSPPPDSGGGGSGSSWINSVTTAEANVYRTPEYYKRGSLSIRPNETSLEQVRSAEAYALLEKNGKPTGGDNVAVMVVDTGIYKDNFEISPNIKPDSTGDGTPYHGVRNRGIEDVSGDHGTYTAAIIAAKKGNSSSNFFGINMHGIAYNSKIVAIKGVPSFESFSDLHYGIDNNGLINSDVKVVNASYSAGTTIDSGFKQFGLNYLRDNNVLMVAATGNDGSDNPDYPALFANEDLYDGALSVEGYVLAVGSVNLYNFISGFSNHCGVAKNYCLVAPGENILSASTSNNFIAEDGTSAAAPFVSGAALLLRAAWPHLTAPQTAQILLRTATDLGDTGVDEVYGHGLLNIFEAMKAQGSNSYSYGTSMASLSYDIKNTKFTSDRIFGDAFTTDIAQALNKMVFFDDYGRDYKANMASKISAAPRSSAMNIATQSILNNYKTNIIPVSFNFKEKYFTNRQSESENLTLAKLYFKSYNNTASKRFLNFDKSKEDNVINNDYGFSFAQNFAKNFKFAFAFNADELRNENFSEVNNFNFLTISSGFASSPYQSFVTGNRNVMMQGNNAQSFNQIFLSSNFLEKKLKFSFSNQIFYSSNSILSLASQKQNQISDFNFSYKINEGNILNFSLGQLNEFNNNFLNSHSVGAFETAKDVKTSYFKIALSKKITEKISLIASYSKGQTRALGNQFGIFRKFSLIESQSSNIGLINNNFFGFRAGLLYNRPLAINRGNVEIDIPIARDVAGNVYRYNQQVSLKTKAPEENFELFFSKNFTENSITNFNLLSIKNGQNIRNNNGYSFVLFHNILF